MPVDRPFVVNRVGSTDRDGYRHFMAGPTGDWLACGGRAISHWNCTKDSGLAQVDCPNCWKTKHRENRV